MSGKRIAREKVTIAKMIALYEKKCPQASTEEGHYQALRAYADKRLDKCAFGKKSRPVNSVPFTATSPRSGRDEAGDALGGAENAVASSDSDSPSSD